MTDAFADIDLTSFATPKIITCTIEGPVEQEDLRRLATRQPPAEGTTAGDLNRIREKHHHVARLVASGMSQRLVASVCGYNESYLSVLLNAPGMQELVGFYRSSHDAAHQVVLARLRSVAMGSVEQLEERLASGDMDDNALLGLAKLGLDRSGHGPRSEVHSVSEHHIFDHNELQRLNRAARREAAEDIITLEAKPVPQPQVESGSSDADSDAPPAEAEDT